ncbi:glycosyltransferase family 4 protein [Leptothermofonsia sp. ETS-13]|uniref:glycosyltransferase family 4 protein n=1 Tax=Leptothermofonsia sp. ETS-13 TaxID=3035696 RepID=UPI003BA07D98
MRILSIHNRYQIRGGEDESRESEELLLREMGHEVDVYEESNDCLASMSSIQVATRTIWSREAYNIVQQHLRKAAHEVVHVQNFFPLISPSVYYAAKSKGVPVVQTLRNYRLLCPNALFFRSGEVCEDCLGKFVPFPGVLHGCYRESRIASAGTAAMMMVHRTLRTWTEMVDVYIALTEFARKKFIQGGLPPKKIIVKPNFVHPDPVAGGGKGGYAIYVGRLSVEKGLDTLLEAWELLSTPLPLKIVGDGPLADQVAKAANRYPHIEWLGRRPVKEVYEAIGEAMFLIFPSKWYETFGRVAVEAFAKGTPVLAAKIGAIAELVDHNRTGFHFCPGDPADLATNVEWILAHPTQLAQMRQEARLEFETRYTAKQNYQKLMEIYEVAQSCKNI